MHSSNRITHTRAVAPAGRREPPTLTLDAHGYMLDCSESCPEFFGCSRQELARTHISELVPELARWELLTDGEPNAHLSYLCHIGHAFEVRPRGGRAFLSHLHLVRLSRAGTTALRLIAHALETPPRRGPA